MTIQTPTRASDDHLRRWVARLADALDIDAGIVDTDEVLLLAKETAHGVARPAAPISAFIVGLAAGRAGGTRADIERAAEVTRELLITAELGSEADA